MATRGEHLAHCISYALIRARKVVRGLSLTLSKEEREAVADAAVNELRQQTLGSLTRKCLNRTRPSFTRRLRIIETATQRAGTGAALPSFVVSD